MEFVLNYDPINNQIAEKIIYLNSDKTSYIRISSLSNDLKNYAIDNFNEMFELHPEKRHTIILRLKEVDVYRWQQSYLNTPPHYDNDVLKNKSYMFSGFNTDNNNGSLPPHFQKYFDYIKSLDSRYNQVVANWYKDKNDYIAYHSDCEIGMIQDADICMISLYSEELDDDSQYRVISIVPKEGVDAVYQKVNIVTRNGTIITMHGNTQKEFRHGIEQVNNHVLPRICLSFRQYV